jgi:hypothetical protein
MTIEINGFLYLSSVRYSKEQNVSETRPNELMGNIYEYFVVIGCLSSEVSKSIPVTGLGDL